MREYIIQGYPRAYGQKVVQELIRCKDCKYYDPKDRNFSCNLFSDLGSANNDDDFCAWAEREEK